MKTRSRLTKKRARGLDISALQHRTAKFAVCQHKLQTKFFFQQNHDFFILPSADPKIFKRGAGGWGEAWAGGGGLGGGGLEVYVCLLGRGFSKHIFVALLYKFDKV